MSNRIKTLLSKLPRINPFMTAGLIMAFAVTYFLMMIFMQRAYGLNVIKKEINKIQESLLEIGWDVAYDKAETSSLPLFSMVVFKNFKLYALDGSFEWNTPEFKIKAGLFDSQQISLITDHEQDFKVNGKDYPADIPVLKIKLGFDKMVGLNEVSIESVGVNIKGVGTMDSFKLASQRMAPVHINELTPFFENHMEAKNIELSEDIKFPLLKKIDRIYANANIIGIISNKATYSQSIDGWFKLGGIIDIRKLVIDWKPLVMVARGDLYFNDKLEPNLHLNTSSKGLSETLDRLQDKFLERKGVFVAKILLNNKSFKLDKDDRYFTVTTPININANQVLIENIPVKKF